MNYLNWLGEHPVLSIILAYIAMMGLVGAAASLRGEQCSCPATQKRKSK